MSRYFRRRFAFELSKSSDTDAWINDPVVALNDPMPVQLPPVSVAVPSVKLCPLIVPYEVRLPEIEAVLSKLNVPVVKKDELAAVQSIWAMTEAMWPKRSLKLSAVK